MFHVFKEFVQVNGYCRKRFQFASIMLTPNSVYGHLFHHIVATASETKIEACGLTIMGIFMRAEQLANQKIQAICMPLTIYKE